MNIIRGKRQHVAADVGEGTLSRRRVLGGLGGLAAVPVLYGIGSATPALAAPAAQPGSVPGDLVRAAERRYNAPLLTTGSRLSLPAGIKVVPIQDFYRRPHVGPAESAWPHMTATDGTTVDASIIPEHGAPTRIAILSGFTEGWYELSHAGGRADRVTWDAGKFPFLWFYGEFGATNEAPYHNWFYTLALQPFSRNPYSRTTPAR